MKLYVTEALRWGDRESHSYVVGVYSTREQAKLAGDAERSWRGGKYECVVTEFELDFLNTEKLDYHKECDKPINQDIDTILSHTWIE